MLDWFEEKSLRAYSISAGQSLLYNDIFPKHKERLGKKMSELVVSAAPGSALNAAVRISTSSSAAAASSSIIASMCSCTPALLGVGKGSYAAAIAVQRFML